MSCIQGVTSVEPDTALSILSEKEYPILIVEDSASNLALIKLYFKKTACRLDHAEDGREAVKKFQQNDYALILMDIQMPVMDGHQATRRIREIEQEKGCAPVPVVAVTASAFDEDKNLCLDSGCTDYLAKPIRKDTLLCVVAQNIRTP